jgi:hypothetical protein
MDVTPPEDVRLAGRNGSIWRDYCAGRTQEALAAEYGLSQARVSQIIRQVRDGIPEEDRELEVQRSLEMLRELRSGALEVWRMVAAPVTAGKDGDLVLDPESGEYVRDHGGRIRALEAALKVDQRIAQLLGLDAATKLDMNVSQGEVRAAEKLAQEAAARVAGAEE